MASFNFVVYGAPVKYGNKDGSDISRFSLIFNINSTPPLDEIPTSVIIMENI
ncbi:MAG: hypothetical protein M3162_00305 [Thermoproteota archaeon]|nr:hypothetical protein [Thermoproteota archaeon]